MVMYSKNSINNLVTLTINWNLFKNEMMKYLNQSI